MKLVRKSIEEDQTGFASMIAEGPEDLWHIYNLIRQGDEVTASTWRLE